TLASLYAHGEADNRRVADPPRSTADRVGEDHTPREGRARRIGAEDEDVVVLERFALAEFLRAQMLVVEREVRAAGIAIVHGRRHQGGERLIGLAELARLIVAGRVEEGLVAEAARKWRVDETLDTTSGLHRVDGGVEAASLLA